MGVAGTRSNAGMNSARAARIGLACALLGAIGFSGKAIIIKLAYRHGVDAVTLLMWRMLLALPLFLALAWWAGRDQPALRAGDWRDIGLLGFTGYYLASFLDFAGLQYISAALERLILYLNPTLVLLMGLLFLGQRASRAQLLALGLSYAGILLVFAQELHFEGRNTLIGSALVLGSALSYAVYLVHSGQVLKRLGALRLTGLATSVACGLCILQFLLLRPLEAAFVPVPVFWLSLLNAIACTFAPVILVMLGIERIGAARAAQTGMVGPMSTLLMGVVLLDEPLTATVLLGTALVLAGVAVLAKFR